MSYLTYWQAHGYMVLWVMISSAFLGGLETLTRHFQRLREKIERKLGYEGVEFLGVKTWEGHGVIHCFLAWERARLFYIPQPWLAEQWERIHGAKVVWVSRVKPGKGHRVKLSWYIVSQYLADQDALVRLAASSSPRSGHSLKGQTSMTSSCESLTVGRVRSYHEQSPHEPGGRHFLGR